MSFMGQAVYVSADQGDLTEGMSKVDLVGLCQGGYGLEFLACPMKMLSIENG